MSSAEEWANVVRFADIVFRNQRAVEDEPALLVQRIARNTVLCGGPIEHFSQEEPVWSPRTLEEERLRPIDVLYGCYHPTTRSIEIFVERIREDAGNFGANADELREIVRIHEHAHAVAHLGSHADDVDKRLSSFDASKRTAWPLFLDERTSWFATFPTEIHEFLAQALTYAALSQISASSRSEKLREVFEALEAKQPPHYKLSVLVKQCAARAPWPLVLDAARGEIVDVLRYREQDFTLRAGIEALVCSVP